MAHILTTSNPSLLEVGHRKVIADSYEMKPKQYPMLFREMQADQWEETFPHLGALGEWKASTEGAPYNEDEVTEGFTATFTHQMYNNSYVITHEAIKWDKYRLMENSATNLGRKAAIKEEGSAAAVINGGFATNGYDGVPLFSGSHPLKSSTALGNNLISGALSDASMKAARTLLRGTVDEAGGKIQSIPDTAWVAANLEWTLATILESTGAAGETSNNKNVLPGMRRAVMDYITDNYWGLADTSMLNLVFMWYEKPHYGMERIPNSDDFRMYGQSAFDVGYADWRGVIGSTGA